LRRAIFQEQLTVSVPQQASVASLKTPRRVAIIYNCRELHRGFFICFMSNADKRCATRDATASASSEGS
jgi:hypothetical protein